MDILKESRQDLLRRLEVLKRKQFREQLDGGLNHGGSWWRGFDKMIRFRFQG